MDKTSHTRASRGEWSRVCGYITRDGFCPCGPSLATHKDRIYHGVTKDPSAADEWLLKSLLGKEEVYQ